MPGEVTSPACDAVRSKPALREIYDRPSEREVCKETTTVSDDALMRRLSVEVKGRWTSCLAAVERCFLHCARAGKRSGLWQPSRWPDSSAVRSMLCTIWDLLPVKPAGMTVEDYERESRERVKVLY